MDPLHDRHDVPKPLVRLPLSVLPSSEDWGSEPMVALDERDRQADVADLGASVRAQLVRVRLEHVAIDDMLGVAHDVGDFPRAKEGVHEDLGERGEVGRECDSVRLWVEEVLDLRRWREYQLVLAVSLISMTVPQYARRGGREHVRWAEDI